MKINKYDLRVNESRAIYLTSVGDASFDTEARYSSPKAIVDIINKAYGANELAEERMYLTTFDNARHLTGLFEVSHGSVNGSAFSVSQILQRVLLIGAVSFIVLHNHPSGLTSPSEPDLDTTRKLKEASKCLDLDFTDHIIISGACKNSYCSLREESDIWTRQERK